MEAFSWIEAAVEVPPHGAKGAKGREEGSRGRSEWRGEKPSRSGNSKQREKRRGSGSAPVAVSWEEGEGLVSARGHALPLTDLWSSEEENFCSKLIHLRSKPDVFSPPSF